MQRGDGDETHGLERPLDLAALRADDDLVEALAAGRTPPAGGSAEQPDHDDELVAMLVAWVAEVRPHVAGPDVATGPGPEPESEPVTASLERPHRAATPYLRRMAVAAAMGVLVTSGLAVGAWDAGPGEALWPMSKVFYAEHARSVEAAADVTTGLAKARAALEEGDPVGAAQTIAGVTARLDVVMPTEGHEELAGERTLLLAELATFSIGMGVAPSGGVAQLDELPPAPDKQDGALVAPPATAPSDAARSDSARSDSARSGSVPAGAAEAPAAAQPVEPATPADADPVPPAGLAPAEPAPPADDPASGDPAPQAAPAPQYVPEPAPAVGTSEPPGSASPPAGGTAPQPPAEESPAGSTPPVDQTPQPAFAEATPADDVPDRPVARTAPAGPATPAGPVAPAGPGTTGPLPGAAAPGLDGTGTAGAVHPADAPRVRGLARLRAVPGR